MEANNNNSELTAKIAKWNQQAGCPKNWKEAEKIEKQMNIEKEWEHGTFVYQPVWTFDVNFKLDFDGPLIRASSRFYPPHKNMAPGWDGKVGIMFIDQEIASKEFKCETLDELHKQVEAYVKTIANKLRSSLL